jgi:aspartyl aminopeptidase
MIIGPIFKVKNHTTQFAVCVSFDMNMIGSKFSKGIVTDLFPNAFTRVLNYIMLFIEST